MNRKNFSLKDIQLLGDPYSQAGSPGAESLSPILNILCLGVVFLSLKVIALLFLGFVQFAKMYSASIP